MKKLSDYVHLYVGCEVKTVDGMGINSGFYYPEVWLEDGKVESNGINVFFPDTKKAFVMNFGQCQLILRPLSDMTEEERKELWQFIFHRPFGKNGRVVFIDKKTLSSDPRWVMSSGVERLGIELNGTIWADSDLTVYKHNQHDITPHLLSKHFDLFGLIESGVAIDKTKLNHAQNK